MYPPTIEDDETDAVSVSVVLAVASTADVDARDLPPLVETIDPDALDQLVESMAAGEITFHYFDHEISVESDGSVTAEPTGRPANA